MHIKPMYGEGMHDPVWIKSLLGVHIAAGVTAFLMVYYKRKFAHRTGVGAASTA